MRAEHRQDEQAARRGEVEAVRVERSRREHAVGRAVLEPAHPQANGADDLRELVREAIDVPRGTGPSPHHHRPSRISSPRTLSTHSSGTASSTWFPASMSTTASTSMSPSRSRVAAIPRSNARRRPQLKEPFSRRGTLIGGRQQLRQRAPRQWQRGRRRRDRRHRHGQRGQVLVGQLRPAEARVARRGRRARRAPTTGARRRGGRATPATGGRTRSSSAAIASRGPSRSSAAATSTRSPSPIGGRRSVLTAPARA